MKKLGTTSFMLIDKHMQEEVRPLEKALFNYHFNQGSKADIIKELKVYQNSDGGFGHGIEADICLPKSSAIATSIGLKHLMLVDDTQEGIMMIKEAIKYLEDTFDESRKGWFCVPREVNDYPHAPWWQAEETSGRTVLDQNWGNPSSELIGYLYKYKGYVKRLGIDELISFAIQHYNSESEYESEHEVYCYIKLYNKLDEARQLQLAPKLKFAIDKLINPDVAQWLDYVPMPLNFVELDSDYLFDIHINEINKNLNFFIDRLDNTSHIVPMWQWAGYADEWLLAQKYWTGVLTLETILKLDKFGRI